MQGTLTASLAIIAALDQRRAIGRANALPWHLPDDLRRFKRLTLDHTVLMGRKTAESIGRALPGRRNLVLTRGGTAPFAGQEAVLSLDAALKQVHDNRVFVIGGAEVYALALPLTNRLCLTWVDTVVPDADAFFSALDMTQWQETSSEPHPADERHAYSFRFADYVRRANPV